MKHLVLLFIALLFVYPVFAETEDLNTQLMRATVKISHTNSTGTGFILYNQKDEKHILVTASHVLENTPGEETSLIFRSKQAEGEYKKEPAKLLIRKEGKPLWTKSKTQDVAVLWITPPNNADLVKISTSILASDNDLIKHKVHSGEKIAYLGYPHREESNPAGFPILRDGPIASFPLVPTQKTKSFFMSSNTFEGDSGGPVFLTRTNNFTPNNATPNNESLNLILGLVIAQRFLDEDMKSIYGATKVRHRLGISIIVHATFIKEAIEQLK